MSSVCHFHFHSEYSLQDSTIKIDDIKKLAEKKNARTIALTDHGVVDGAVKFYQKLKDSDVIPLLGCEFYVADDLNPEKKDKTRYHAVAIAKNRNGFTSIMKALTMANLEGFYYRPRINWDMLLNLEDVIISTACTSGIINNHKNWDELLTKLYIKFKDDFYLEQILLTDFAPQRELNFFIRTLSEKLGIRMLFTNDVHYAEKEDWKYREVHSASGYNRKFGKGQEDAGTKDLYFKTYEQMIKSLSYLDMKDLETHMVETWDEILDKCKDFKLEKLQTSVPVAYSKAESDPSEYLKNICRDEFDKRVWANEEETESRMEHELKEICDLGFAEYFLLVQDMVDVVRAKGVMIGPGRGSV